MNKELKNIADCFLENLSLLRKEFKFESESSYLAGGLLYAQNNKHIDIKHIKECYNILKKNTGVFSDYRTIGLHLILEMSLAKNPTQYFENVKYVYESLNKSDFFGSYYKIVASLLICDNNREKDIENIISRYQYMHDKMKETHPLLTGEDDIPFNVLLAMTDDDMDKLVDKSEACYQLMKKRFSNKDELQSLGQIFALLDKSAEESCEKFIELADKLKEKKRKIDSQFLSVFGTLLFIDKDIDKLIDDILAVDQYLGSKKGNGYWIGNKVVRLACATSLVEIHYGCDKSKKFTSIFVAAIRQQIATMIATDVILFS